MLFLSLSWVYMHFKFFAPHIQDAPGRRNAEQEKQLLDLEKKRIMEGEKKRASILQQPDDQKVAFLNDKHSVDLDQNDQIMHTEERTVTIMKDNGSVTRSRKSNKVFPLSPVKGGDLEIYKNEKDAIREAEEEAKKLLKESQEEDARDGQKRRILLEIALNSDKEDPRMKVILSNYIVIFSSGVLGFTIICTAIVSLIHLQYQLEVSA